MDVGIREFKLHFSEYLARVRRGDVLVITDRGTPVARVDRVHSARTPAVLDSLVKSGRLILKPPPRHLAGPVRMLPGAKSAQDYVAEQRR